MYREPEETSSYNESTYYKRNLGDEAQLLFGEAYAKRSYIKFWYQSMRRSGQGGLKAYRYDGSFGEVDETNRIASSILLSILLLLLFIIGFFTCPTCIRECDFCTCERELTKE